MVRYSSHAQRRMHERGVTKAEVEGVLRRPLAVKETRYGRRVACGSPDDRDKYTVVIFEENAEDLIVITALKVDRDRLERYGFTRVR